MVGILLAVSFGTGPVTAQSEADKLACGTAYVVQSGDTLYSIAERVYGEGRHFDAIQRAGGETGAKLDLGDVLSLPCLNAQLAATQLVVTSDVPVPQSIPEALEAPTGSIAPGSAAIYGRPHPDTLISNPIILVPRPLRIGIERGAGPWQADIVAGLVDEALDQPDGLIDYFELDDLSIDGSWDLALPWAHECAAECGLALSQPIYVVQLRVYIRGDDPTAEAPRDLTGRRLCLPADQHLPALEMTTLGPLGMHEVQATTAGQCFAMLGDRRVDAVMLSSSENVRGATEATGLAVELTFRVAVDLSRDGAAELVDLIDRGISNLKESGRWFEAVQAAHAGSGLQR